MYIELAVISEILPWYLNNYHALTQFHYSIGTSVALIDACLSWNVTWPTDLLHCKSSLIWN